MNKILREFVPKKTIFFLDDISKKGCKDNNKDLTLEEDGCCIFVKEYIEDMEHILKKLEEVNLTLSFEKSTFGFKEIIIVGYLCRSYRKKSNLDKIDAIARMKVCRSITKIRCFLNAYVFYHI